MELYTNNSATYLLKDAKGIWFSIYDGTKRGYPPVVSQASYPIMADTLCKYQRCDVETLEHLKEEMDKAGVKFDGAAN